MVETLPASRRLARNRITAGGVLVLGLLAAGVAPAAAQAPRAARLAPTACHLDGLPDEVLCGRHEVFEDRARREGRRIALRVAVLPALRRDPRPDPVFLLAGGPGQGATILAGPAARGFRPLRRTRDIVLVDLRGTGESNPLRCDMGGDLDVLLGAFPADALKRCLATLDADPRLYGTAWAVDDLDEVRQALGYERINLWGGSYGTRVALVYARRHPERVRSVVLDGAAPFGIRLPLHFAAGAERALGMLVDACIADRECATAWPGLRAELDRLLEGLAAAPAQTAIVHPRTGERVDATITRSMFAAGVRGFLYVPGHGSLVPMVVHRAAMGDFGPFAALALETASWSVDTMSLGLALSVVCSEDMARVAEADIPPAVAGTFIGRADLDLWREWCAVWPRGETPADVDAGADTRPGEAGGAGAAGMGAAGAAAPLAIPALILSGDFDPVTGPEWGDVMKGNFLDALHVVVPGAAHNTSFSGCVPDLIARFVERGTVAGGTVAGGTAAGGTVAGGATAAGTTAGGGAADPIDTACVTAVRRPPFVLGFAGTVP